MTFVIVLFSGERSFVDEEDFNWLKEYRWLCSGSGGIKRPGRWTKIDGKRKWLFMYREILEKHGLLKEGFEVDHVNGNALDNRKANLRLCTRSQNMMNRITGRRSRNGSKGVHERQTISGLKYDAHIKANGKKIHLGSFNDLDEAKLAYAAAAKTYFGEFAKV
jgi:hypothetical protein